MVDEIHASNIVFEEIMVECLMNRLYNVIKSFIMDPQAKWRYLFYTPMGKFVSDEFYLKKMYKDLTGKELNLDNPQTFNEKLQWLKLHDRNPLYTKLVDKYEVKQYIKEKLGEEYVIPLVGGPWDKVSDIDFEALPNQFVLKTTHDSGGVIICRNKNELNWKSIVKRLDKSLKKNFYYVAREWAYKEVKPRIIAERFMEDPLNLSLNDYKLHCFNGKVKLILVCIDRESNSGIKKIFYDEQWNKLELKRPDSSNVGEVSCPKGFNKMIDMAEKLSKDIPFVRVDFYDINGHIYFGEMTFYPEGGFVGFEPVEWNQRLGEYIELSGGLNCVLYDGGLLETEVKQLRR